MYFKRSSSVPLTLVLTGFFIGCSKGPELADVSGKVTQDGKAIPFAYVVYQPVEPPGTYASAYTDAEGNYRVQFTASREGALIGRHEVTVRTAGLDEIEVEDRTTGKMVTPVLPVGYRPKLQLVYEREVQTGANVIDLDLALGNPQEKSL
jgi:hypothetical protein